MTGPTSHNEILIDGAQLLCPVCGSHNMVLRSDTSVTRKLSRVQEGVLIFDSDREVDEDSDRLLCEDCGESFPVRQEVAFE